MVDRLVYRKKGKTDIIIECRKKESPRRRTLELEYIDGKWFDSENLKWYTRIEEAINSEDDNE